uniref:Transmembrane protein n=1 Tax=Medicago truncatula TaxID=3880 RepID=I3T115_MEDTR|nr:unknown [Medicago truncatula]
MKDSLVLLKSLNLFGFTPLLLFKVQIQWLILRMVVVATEW